MDVHDLTAVTATLRAAGSVFAEDEARLLLDGATGDAALQAMIARRVAGEPLEHILGWAAFCGLRIAVEPGVFVPRRRSEFLARQAVAATSRGAVVVELCCGSGAVTATLVAAVGDVDARASDIEPAAVRCARRNLPVTAHVYEGDLFAPLPDQLRGRVDVLVANAPYVPTDEIELMPPEAREHEPRRALDGGGDGLDVHRRVIAEAPRWLASGGHLLIETSTRQAPLARDLMTAAGLVAKITYAADADGAVIHGVAVRSHEAGDLGP